MSEHEVFELESERVAVHARSRRLTGSTRSFVAGTGLRWWNQGNEGFSCVDASGQSALDYVLHNARAQSRKSGSICPFPANKGSVNDGWPQDSNPLSISLAERFALDAEAAAFSIGATATEQSQVLSASSTTRVRNTLGLDTSCLSVAHQVSVVAVCEGRHGAGTGAAYSMERDVAKLDAAEVGRRAARLAAVSARRPVRPVDIPVVLAPGAAKGLARWLAESCESLSDEGRLLPNTVSLAEDRRRPESLTASTHDGEGLSTMLVQIVDLGTVVARLGTFRQATERSEPPTATAYRSYNTQPRGKAVSPLLEITASESDDCLDDCIVIVGWSGTAAVFDGSRSILSVGSQGYVCRNRELVAPLPRNLVLGDFLGILASARRLPRSAALASPGPSGPLLRVDARVHLSEEPAK